MMNNPYLHRMVHKGFQDSGIAAAAKHLADPTLHDGPSAQSKNDHMHSSGSNQLTFHQQESGPEMHR